MLCCCRDLRVTPAFVVQALTHFHHPERAARCRVFFNEQGKWAVVDATPLPEFEVYYTVGGVPQSALDMHRHVVNGTMDKVVEVHTDQSHKVEKNDNPAWTFYYVRWLTRWDVVTNTRSKCALPVATVRRVRKVS